MSFDLPPATGWEGGDHMPRGFDALWTRLRKIEDKLDGLTGANILSTAGVRPERDILRILGSLLVEGDLSVPNGSIDNAALAAPVGWGYGTNAQTGFGLTTSYQSFAPAPLVVPAGYNSVILMVFGTVSVKNAAGSGADWFFVEAGLTGGTTGGIPTIVQDGSWGTQGILGVILQSGLTAEATISTAVRAFAQSRAWPADPGTRAYTRTVGLFFRS